MVSRIRSSQCAVHFPVRCSGGTDARRGAQRPLPSALSNPAQGLGPQQGDSEPRGHTVSTSETGYSIRVTPTCKTDNCIDKTAPEWGSSTSQAPAWEGRVTGQVGQVLLPRIRQHNIASFIFGKEGTGKADLGLQRECSPGLCLPLAAGRWALPQAWVGSASPEMPW